MSMKKVAVVTHIGSVGMFDIPFGGERHTKNLFVLDCKINWSFKDDEASMDLQKTLDTFS